MVTSERKEQWGAGGGGKDMGRLAGQCQNSLLPIVMGIAGRLSSRGLTGSDFYFRKNTLSIDKEK